MKIHVWILVACALFAGLQAGALKAQNFDGTPPTITGDSPAPAFNNVDCGPAYARDSSGNLWFLYSNGSSAWQVWKGPDRVNASNL